MIVMLILKFISLLVMYALGNVSWSNYLEVQKVPEDKVVLQINSGNTEFNTHVGIDWLVALLAIIASILALVAGNKIVYKLKNKQTDWRNEYR